MNRIDKKFQELRDQGASAFMPYVCAGDPNPELASKILLIPAGIDLIESPMNLFLLTNVL